MHNDNYDTFRLSSFYHELIIDKISRLYISEYRPIRTHESFCKVFDLDYGVRITRINTANEKPGHVVIRISPNQRQILWTANSRRSRLVVLLQPLCTSKFNLNFWKLQQGNHFDLTLTFYRHFWNLLVRSTKLIEIKADNPLQILVSISSQNILE